MRSVLRSIVNANVELSRRFDTAFPAWMRADGNRDFIERFAPKYLERGMTLYDIGGGKQPFLTRERKRAMGCRVVGVDISEDELARAPHGAYDSTIVADIRLLKGAEDADLVLCQALLEHVPSIEPAIKSMASVLRPGGKLLLFVPCRNAPFARLNRLLPESAKRRLLFTIFPEKEEAQGFRSYYDHCTPSEITSLAKAARMNLLEIRRYYTSSYFSFFFPAYAMWRLWTLVEARRPDGDSCETFSMAFVKGG